MRSKLYEMDPGVGNYLEKMLPAFRNENLAVTREDTNQRELQVIKTQPSSWQWGDGVASPPLEMPIQ